MLNRSTIASREGGAGKSGSSPPSATTMPTNRRKRRPRNRPFSSRQIADWARPQRRLSSRCVQPRVVRRRLTMPPTISQPSWISGCRSRRESMLHGMSQGYRPALITPLRVTSPVLTAMPQSGISAPASASGSREVGIRICIWSCPWVEGASANRADVRLVDAAEWHHALRGVFWRQEKWASRAALLGVDVAQGTVPQGRRRRRSATPGSSTLGGSGSRRNDRPARGGPVVRPRRRVDSQRRSRVGPTLRRGWLHSARR